MVAFTDLSGVMTVAIVERLGSGFSLATGLALLLLLRRPAATTLPSSSGEDATARCASRQG